MIERTDPPGGFYTWLHFCRHLESQGIDFMSPAKDSEIIESLHLKRTGGFDVKVISVTIREVRAQLMKEYMDGFMSHDEVCLIIELMEYIKPHHISDKLFDELYVKLMKYMAYGLFK